jgi:hypothetical protein
MAVANTLAYSVKRSVLLLANGNQNGVTTLSIVPLSMTTVGIMTLSIMTLSIMGIFATLSINDI